MPAYRGSKLKVWAFPSHSTPDKNYETVQWSNGELTCNCRGWIYPKNGNPRTCAHVRRAELELRDSARADMRRQPPIGLKEVARRNREAEEIARKRIQAEFETNERLYVSPPPSQFKKYKRLIRVDTEA
jgi:hypothetical protein